MTTTSQQPDLYEALGLKPSATDREIVRAWRRLVRECHPDIAGQESTAKFRLVQEAYECLHDPSKKAAYDKRLSPYAPPPAVPQAEDINVAGTPVHVEYRFDTFDSKILANVFVQLDDINIHRLTTLPHFVNVCLERVHAMNGEAEAFSTCIYPMNVCDFTDKLAVYERSQRWQRLTSRLRR